MNIELVKYFIQTITISKRLDNLAYVDGVISLLCIRD